LGHFSVGERVILKWISIQITYEIVGWIYVTGARFRRKLESPRSKGCTISSIIYRIRKILLVLSNQEG